MPGLGKRPDKRRETFPGLGKRPDKRWETFPGLGKRQNKQRDEKQETIYNHFIKKKEFIMANESKVIQIGTIDLHSRQPARCRRSARQATRRIWTPCG